MQMRHRFKLSAMWLPVTLIVVTFVNTCHLFYNPHLGYKIHRFGERIDGDVLAYQNKGAIPLFKPIYKVKLEPNRKDVEKNMTLVTVEYLNRHTEIVVSYDGPTQTVTFRWKYPFVHTEYIIKGYSLPSQLTNQSQSMANYQSLINEFIFYGEFILLGFWNNQDESGRTISHYVWSDIMIGPQAINLKLKL